MNKILKFERFKVEINKEKICKCDKLDYEIDVENRLITCSICGAIIDPFEAIRNFAQTYEDYQNDVLKLEQMKINYIAEIEELHKKKFHTMAFREIEKHTKENMLPHCPKCDEMFEFGEIRKWTNKEYKDLHLKE